MTMLAKDNLNNAIGVDSADNQFPSTNITSNADGTVLERMEYLQSMAIVGNAPASQSYMKVQADLNRSYVLVEADAVIVGGTSYTKVQADLDRSYMKVHGDLVISRILLLPSS